MLDILNFSTADLQVFMLVLIRIAAVFTMAPILGGTLMDNRVKGILTLILSMLVFPLVDRSNFIEVSSVLALAPLIIKEFTVGLIIGFAASLIFHSVQVAGLMIGRQMGLAMANVFDPETQEEMPVVGQYLSLFVSVLFLAVDGHHWLLRAFMQSYQVISLGGLHMNAAFYEQIVYLTGNVFIIGVKLCAPVFVCVFLMTIVLGILSRAVASMNIFAVGFPIKILIGMFLLCISLETFAVMFLKFFSQFQNDVATLILTLA